MDVVSAITNFCNVFFNAVGLLLGLKEVVVEPDDEHDDAMVEKVYSSELGIEKLRKYAEMFGLDQTSGLEIPESEPQISDEASIPSAMGQGTNNYTTSQLARYIGAVSNKGTVYNLTLFDRVEKVDGTITVEFRPVLNNVVEGISSGTWNAVHSGMRGVILNNTGLFSKLNGSGIELYGKTGTAQQSTTHADHGLFVGFVQNNGNSDIAFAIRIANGYSSTFAAEVGRDVMEYYYQVTDPSEIINGSASTVDVSSHGD